MSWADVVAKFEGLVRPHADTALREELVSVIRDLERHDVSTLTGLLARISP